MYIKRYYQYIQEKVFYMKLILLVGILLIYFPLLYYFKRRICKELADTSFPEHMRWYESSLYVIKTSSDENKKVVLIKLHRQIRIISVSGIVLFWFVLLFFRS